MLYFWPFNAGGEFFDGQNFSAVPAYWTCPPSARRKRQRWATRTTIESYLPTNRKFLFSLSFNWIKTVAYFKLDQNHANQKSPFRSKNRSGTAISEGLTWRHPTPDPRGPILFCAILESRNRLFVFGSHLKQLSESHGRLRITPPLLLLMSAVKTRAWQHLETFALGAVVHWGAMVSHTALQMHRGRG